MIISKRYITSIVTLVIFTLDCITQNVGGESETWEQAYWLAHDYVEGREYVITLLYFALLLDLKKDLFDRMLIVLVILSQLVTVWDFAHDASRSAFLDWWAFLTVGLIIVSLKVIKWNFWKIRL